VIDTTEGKYYIHKRLTKPFLFDDLSPLYNPFSIFIYDAYDATVADVRDHLEILMESDFI
jgi:hypothetical protein